MGEWQFWRTVYGRADRMSGEAAEEGVLPLPEEAVARIKKEFGMRKKEECSEEKKRIGEPSEEVAVWSVLADTWLKYNRKG